jgi:hypothetical protein
MTARHIHLLMVMVQLNLKVAIQLEGKVRRYHQTVRGLIKQGWNAEKICAPSIRQDLLPKQ